MALYPATQCLCPETELVPAACHTPEEGGKPVWISCTTMNTVLYSPSHPMEGGM